MVQGLLLAALGYGKECYGFHYPMAPSVPPFCLPVYGIQQLIEELDIQNAKNLDKPYLKVSESKYSDFKSVGVNISSLFKVLS